MPHCCKCSCYYCCLFSLAADTDTVGDRDTFAADTDTLGRKSQNYWQLFYDMYLRRRGVCLSLTHFPALRETQSKRDREGGREGGWKEGSAVVIADSSMHSLSSRISICHSPICKSFRIGFFIYELRKQLFKAHTHTGTHRYTHTQTAHRKLPEIGVKINSPITQVGTQRFAMAEAAQCDIKVVVFRGLNSH